MFKQTHKKESAGIKCTVFKAVKSVFLLKPWSNGLASSRKCGKLNLRRDLRWVAKRTGKFPHKNTRVAKNPFQGRHILYFIG